MKTNSQIIRNLLFSFLSLATTAAFSAAPASAQSTPQSAAAVSQASPVPARITQAIDDSNLVTLHRGVYPLARPEFDQGAVPDSLPVNGILLDLQRSADQETALRALLDEQQTKNSPNYHAWLTPQQFGQEFGVADADVQKITNWLAQEGFTGMKTLPGNMFIQFNGTAGMVRTGFHTEIHNFLVNGEKHMANVCDPQIPAALVPVVARIHSLHDFRKRSFLHRSDALEHAIVNGKLKPQFGTGTGIYAVGPADLAKIYNIPATVAGAPAGMGQTIAIVERSNINVQDINDYGNGFNLANLKAFTQANNVIVNGPDPGIVPGDADEATVDVEMAGAVAPNATILMVVNGGTETGVLAQSQPTDGVDQSALYIVVNNLAPVMSQSFGACEADSDTAFNSTLWEQAAAQGITVTVSTGDSGSDVCDADQGNLESTLGLSVSGSASTPFNVAVGGTDFDDASNPTMYWNNTAALETALGYIPEITWNNGCAAAGSLTGCTSVNPNGSDLAGGSGGQSNCGVQNYTTLTCTGYTKPSWQSAPGVPADSLRDIPDVALFAAVNSPSNNFYIICDSAGNEPSPGQPCNLTGTGSGYNFAGFGGTSLSTPAFAAMIALVNQSELAAGRGGRQGNANYVLYKLATAQGTSPGTSACNSSLGPSGINSGCVFNDVTKGNNSVICDAGSLSCSNTGTSGYGILVEPSKPNPPFSATTPGWTTTAGYDLATGLGTVNAANLISKWSTVTTNFAAATPAITSPASGTVNITHGNSVSFTITVTQGSGTTVPTGDVALIAEPPGFAQVGVGSGTLSGGKVTISTNMLPGDDTTGSGTAYPVIAHYAGDGTFGPSNSTPTNVTVNRENSTTTGTVYTQDLYNGNLIAATSIGYGTAYIMIVNVVGATAGSICNNSSTTSATNIPAVPCPTGNITLTDNGAPLNDFIKTGSNNTNISSVGNLGFVEDLLIQLSGGSSAIVAAYSGDNSYNPSNSATNTITVNPGPTQTGLTVNGGTSASVTTAQAVTLVAMISTNYTQTCNVGSTPVETCQSASNGAGPTGTVTFSTCGTPPCTATVVPTAYTSANGGAFGTATLTTTFTTAGTKTVSASFTPADGNYSSSVSTSSVTVTVTQATVGNFTMAAGPATVATTAAASGTSSGTSAITITPSGGFNTAVTVTCGTIPGVNCTALTIPAGTLTDSLTINVNNPSSSMTAMVAPDTQNEWAANKPERGGRAGWWSLSAGTGFAAVLLLFLPDKKRYRAALGLGLACVLSFSLGCGGGSSGGGGGGGGGGGLTLTVTQLTVSSTKVADSPNATLTVSATVTGGTPTGTVQFMVDGAVLGGPATLTSGSTGNITVMAAQAPAFLQLVGTHTVSANYSGGTTTAASHSGTLNVTITGTTSLPVTGTAGTDTATSSVALTIN